MKKEYKELDRQLDRLIGSVMKNFTQATEVTY